MWKEQKEGQKSLWYVLLLSEEFVKRTKREPPQKKQNKTKRTKPPKKGKTERKTNGLC